MIPGDQQANQSPATAEAARPNLSTNFSFQNKTYQLRPVGGVVIATDQRAETHVSGSASMVVIDGNGSGSSRISSKVRVLRDVWIRAADGVEHHIRIDGDVPVREGQTFYALQLNGTSTKDVPFDCAIRYYNQSMDESWQVNRLAQHLGTSWAISKRYWTLAALLFLILGSSNSKIFFAIGLMPLAILICARLYGVPSSKSVIENRKALLVELQKQADTMVHRIAQARREKVPAA